MLLLMNNQVKVMISGLAPGQYRKQQIEIFKQ